MLEGIHVPVTERAKQAQRIIDPLQCVQECSFRAAFFLQTHCGPIIPVREEHRANVGVYFRRERLWSLTYI